MDVFVQSDSLGAKKLPLTSEQEFNFYLDKFAKTTKGEEYVKQQILGFDAKTGELVVMKI